MKNEDRMTIFLSPGELFWIAGNLGLKNLPLLSAFFRGQDPEKMRALIQQGFDTLVTRNLVYPQGSFQTEVDPTLTSIVELIASPSFVNVIGSIRKQERPIQVYMYFQKSDTVSVIYKDRFFHFTLYREMAALRRSLLAWLGIHAQLSEHGEDIQLPATDFGELLQEIWKRPASGPEAPQNPSPTTPEAKSMAFLAGITLYSSITRIGLQDDRLVKQAQFTLLGNTASLWVHQTVEALPQKLDFKLLSAHQAVQIAARYIKPIIVEENEEDQLIE